MNLNSLATQLDEFNLIKCSLLPDEDFAFTSEDSEDSDAEIWTSLVAFAARHHPLGGVADLSEQLAKGGRFLLPASPACVCITSTAVIKMAPTTTTTTTTETENHAKEKKKNEITKIPISTVSIKVPFSYAGNIVKVEPVVSIKLGAAAAAERNQDGDDQWERWWRRMVEEEIGETEYPIYQLVTSLLPLLRETFESPTSTLADTSPSPSPLSPSTPPAQQHPTTPHPTHSTTKKPTPTPTPSPQYHALLTSHHLLSPTKRRSLQSWSASLSLSGFAKVGYPGVIYAQGRREDVEEFVADVKGMRWLALRVRFVEELVLDDGCAMAVGAGPGAGKETENLVSKRGRSRWCEFQKVGEVVEEMKRLGREKFIVDMGIGAAGTK